MKIAPFRKRHRFALPDHAGPTLPAGASGGSARCPAMRETRFSGRARLRGKALPFRPGLRDERACPPHRKPCAPNRGFGRKCACPAMGRRAFSGPPACAGKPCPSDRGFGTSAHARLHRKPCAPNRGFGRKCACPAMGRRAFFRPRALPTGASGGIARCPAMGRRGIFEAPRPVMRNAVPFHRGNRARPRVCTETPALPTGAFERNCTRCPSTRETRALQPPRPAMQESRHIFARPACIRGKERPPSPLRPAGGEGRSPSIRTFASHENRRRSGGARRSACAARRGWYTPSPPPAPQSRRWCSERREIPPERESTRWG